MQYFPEHKRYRTEREQLSLTQGVSRLVDHGACPWQSWGKTEWRTMMATTALSCRCGKVHLEVVDAPIISAECHCHSCRDAARRMAGLPGASPITEPNGGTPFVMYRKDRVRITSGKEWLRNFRLAPDRQTRRVLATCCNTPVLLEFKGGHWASLYGTLWPEGARPAPDLRTVTGDVPDGVVLDDAVPAGRWPTTKFIGKLFAAWASMGFRAPVLALDTPEISVPA